MVHGDLHSVEDTEIGLIAVIGEITVSLPEELAEKLQALVGKRIGILRLDGYHVRCLEANMAEVAGGAKMRTRSKEDNDNV
jgi:hypothetical protein